MILNFRNSNKIEFKLALAKSVIMAIFMVYFIALLIFVFAFNYFDFIFLLYFIKNWRRKYVFNEKKELE